MERFSFKICQIEMFHVLAQTICISQPEFAVIGSLPPLKKGCFCWLVCFLASLLFNTFSIPDLISCAFLYGVENIILFNNAKIHSHQIESLI